MRKTLLFLVAACAFAFSANAQPRPMEVKPETKPTPVKPAPESFATKYEGGVFGYSKKEDGTLKFDDINERLVFYGADQKEKFALPYRTLLIIYPQSKSVQTTAGKVISVAGGGPLGGFIKEKRRYLIVHFDDPDVDARGVVNFRIEDQALLDSVVATLANKAELKARGDAYYRPKKAPKPDEQK
jgi:hypothetical protein